MDFDFEKLCSISLSNLNVYACLICGKYFQGLFLFFCSLLNELGRGRSSYAYFHSLDEAHHVYINLHSLKIYVLPESYEVRTNALDDIKYVLNPTYTKEQVMAMDTNTEPSYDLDNKKYFPGFVGLNNIKQNNYLNCVIQALSHVTPFRNYFILENFTGKSELVQRLSILIRKIWNAKAFRGHVSPHELLQEVSSASGKQFRLTEQSDPLEFLSWLLNTVHCDLGGSKTKPESSVIHKIFQGKVRIQSQQIIARSDANDADRLRFEVGREIKENVSPFLFLTLDLPLPPLLQDEFEDNIIPQACILSGLFFSPFNQSTGCIVHTSCKIRRCYISRAVGPKKTLQDHSFAPFLDLPHQTVHQKQLERRKKPHYRQFPRQRPGYARM